MTLPDAELQINADHELMSSAVGNLLHNAFKFTREKTEVRLDAHTKADRVLIEVHDCCGGLPAELADSASLAFPQTHKDRSGLGLGLQICLRYIK